MKLYILDLGKIVMVGDNPVVENDTAGGSVTMENAPAIPVYACLIDSPAGWVLFDAGCHPEGMKIWPDAMKTNPYVYPEGETLEKKLERLGLKPSDISIVVLSHMHLDHMGCAYMFPNAKVYVQADELKNTMDAYKNGTLDIFHLECDLKAAEEAGVEFTPVASAGGEPGEATELCEGLKILDFRAGHSDGMLGLYVELSGGRYILASDAIYSSYHYGPPARFSGAVTDKDGYIRAIEYIRGLAESTGAKVLFGHDMPDFQALRKSDEGCYE